MSEQYTEKSRIKSTPDIRDAKGLREAMKTLAPMIKSAQSELKKLPLRPITNPMTSEEIMVRFATAEELQRIIMRTCKGYLIVNTLPVRLGNDPAVVAQPAILTKEGYITLPGSHASQRIGEGSRDFGYKQLLVAETRAIRRALREMGLRAEYEEYDVADQRQSEMTETNRSKKTAKQAVKEKVSDLNDQESSEEQAAEEDIPSMPDTAFEQKEDKSSRRSSKKSATKKASKPEKKSSKSGVKKKVQEVSYPDEPLNIEVDVEHPDWPSKRSISYQNDILNALSSVKSEKSLTVESMVKQVFGKDHKAHRRLATYTAQELETLYQFFVIQAEE